MPIEWYGDEVRKRMERAQQMAIDETTAACVRQAKRKLKAEGSIVTATLQGAIQMRDAKPDARGVVGRWGTYGVSYGLAVELGTDPHMPPIDALEYWALRKFGDADMAWPVALKIARVGTRERPFLRPAADSEYPKLAGRLRRYTP